MVFIESRSFTRRLLELAAGAEDDLLQRIQSDLLRNHEKGTVVPGLGGIRKARATNPSRRKGKRGGYRYLYLYLERRDHIHLLFLLDKDEQEDMTPAQRADLRRMVGEIKRS